MSSRPRPWRLLALLFCVVSLTTPPTRAAAQAVPRPVITPPRIAVGVNPQTPPGDGSGLADYVSTVGTAPRIVMWYQTWNEPLYYAAQMPDVDRVGAVPMITWEPHLDQPLQSIAAGAHDDYLRASAQQAIAYGKPMLIRFAHEMNGDWYPWGRGVNGNTPQDYVAAWRHVVSVFREAGATNVRWVWSPNVMAPNVETTSFDAYYPGDDWVDWLALDGYNDAKAGGRSFVDVFGASYERLTRLAAKPVMIGETASAEESGSKAGWITQGFLDRLPIDMPRVRAVVWFDRLKERDWRIDSSTASLDAWRHVVTSPLYQPAYDVADPPPVVTIAHPDIDGSGLAHLEASTPAAGGASYHWDFGDGTPIVATATPEVDHRFSDAGSHAVVVQATSSAGIPSTPASRTVEVGAVRGERKLSCLRLRVTRRGPRMARLRVSCRRRIGVVAYVRVSPRPAHGVARHELRFRLRPGHASSRRIQLPASRKRLLIRLRVGAKTRRVPVAVRPARHGRR